MDTVTAVDKTELNQNRQHYTPLTEEQKLYNRKEAFKTLFQITLEEVIKRGDIQNV